MLYKKLLSCVKDYVLNHHIEILDGNNEFEVSFLAQGEYNINYLVETKNKKIVLRLNMASQLNLENQIKYEYNALQFLALSNVTPKPYFLDDSKKEIPYGILTMEYLGGRSLNYKTDLQKAAKIFAKIHTMDITNKHEFIIEKELFSARVIESKWLLENIWNSNYIQDDVKNIFSKFLIWAEKNQSEEKYFLEHGNMVLNNTEVNSSNFIIGKKDYLIDWEKPVVSDCVQDITQFLIPTTTLWKTDIVLTDVDLNFFYKEYSTYLGCSISSIKDKVELYKPYMYLRALSWCAHAFVEYSNATKNIVNNDTFEKLNQYLDVNQLYHWIWKYIF